MTDDYVVYPTGDVDLATWLSLRDDWYTVIDEYRPARLVVDMAAVDFIDSSGLQLLVTVLKRQRGHGGTVAVVNASPTTQKVMRLTGIDTLVPVTLRTMPTTPPVTSGTAEGDPAGPGAAQILVPRGNGTARDASDVPAAPT